MSVCGILVAVRRHHGRQRPRVVRGPSGGTWYEYKFRAKPGAKYRYRALGGNKKHFDDRFIPEWGVWPPEAKGRRVKYGVLFNKGKAMGLTRYEQEKKAMRDAAKEPELGACALLIDCDGTIVETERDGHRVAFNKAFEEMGFDCSWDVELYGELLTTGGGKERMTRYFTDYNPEAWKDKENPPAKDHPDIVALHKRKTELFMEIVRSGMLPLRPGITELLAAATEAGWKIAVCSTSNEKAVAAVVETMLPEYADSITIFAGDVVKTKKPDPAIYTLAAKQLGVAPMKCVVVEDTNIGLQAGKAAGMQVIVTKSIYSETEDFADADVVVSSADELDFEEDVMALLPTMELA
jgi:HAD superfamily hydrolase (TIGR01509 family)